MRYGNKPCSYSFSWKWLLLLANIACCAIATTAAATPNQWYSHGFHIDGHLINAEQYARVHDPLDRQLEIVESVGLPDNVLNFFHTVPIIIDPSLQGEPGVYGELNGVKAVRIRPIPFPADMPIVLHELLHAYHDQVLTLDNVDIRQAFRQARTTAMYPARFQSAHFLDNKKEYFAVIGSIYLFGKIHQPPFVCNIPRQQQPEFMAFLARQFGYHDCKID